MKKLAAALALVAAIALAIVAGTSGGSRAGTTPSGETNPRLERFGSCAEFLAYVKTNALTLLGPESTGTTSTTATTGVVAIPTVVSKISPSSPEGDYSGTNVQEAGVDEPDIVKTNGSILFAVAREKLYAVDVGGHRPRLLGWLPLKGSIQQLLLHGNRLLVIAQDSTPAPFAPGGSTTSVPMPVPRGPRGPVVPYGLPETILTEVDVGDPTSMQVVRSLTVQASYLDARLVKGTVRIVISASMPHGMAFTRDAVASSGIDDWLPTLRLEDALTGTTTTRPAVDCGDTWHPADFSGFGLLTVLTIDLARGVEPVDSDAILTGGGTVYASPKSLYIATQPWSDFSPREVILPDSRTALHKFAMSTRSSTDYRASGEVSGSLLNEWSLSEHKGVLRVVTTEPRSGPEDRLVGQRTESFVTTLEEKDGALVRVGRLGGLGRDEDVYGVRFLGDTGYVVTFRQKDPLHTLDLSNPARPRLVGELKIPGYSAYLHPAGEDLLLGLGQDATGGGQVVGTQLSLFDISYLPAPVRLYHRTVELGRSEAESEHHAFLYWPAARLVVIPIDVEASGEPGNESGFRGAIAFRVSRLHGITLLGRVLHGRNGRSGAKARRSAMPISRALVVGGTLYTVSELGVRANSVRTLGKEGWVAFQDQPPPARRISAALRHEG